MMKIETLLGTSRCADLAGMDELGKVRARSHYGWDTSPRSKNLSTGALTVRFAGEITGLKESGRPVSNHYETGLHAFRFLIESLRKAKWLTRRLASLLPTIMSP
jgi:hypothetical protein